MKTLKLLNHRAGLLRHAVAAMAALIATTALADQVKVNNIWIPQVQVLGVEDGELSYVTPGGSDSSKPLAEIQGIRLEKYPQYEQADEAYKEARDEEAVKLLTEVRKQARGKDEWVANDMGMKLAATLDRMGQADDAVTAYLELVAQDADAYFLAYPPLGSVSKLSDDEKAKLQPKIQRALRRNRDAPDALKQLLAAATPGQAAPAATDAAQGNPGSTQATPTPAPGPGSTQGPYPPPPQSAVLLPETVERGEVADLVVAGKFEEAVKMADGLMISLPKPETMFLKGMAQLALAEKSKDDTMYKDAGLNFMRVAIYFPGSPHTGPSLLETGYIHAQLGLPDKAAELYALAADQLDEESTPRYLQRLQELSGSE